MQPILDIKNVDKLYAKHQALKDVSLQVPKGSIFGLLGPNGAGKTSLIRIINQITGPDAGEVLFNGELLKPKHTERIGYLPEERGLYRKMKVGEQATYLCMLKGLDRKTANQKLKHWFEKFQIVDWWDKKVEDLSKGMQQKVQFIVTVLHEPELIILDEPFSGFDPINTNLIKSEILELRDKGTTVIFSTHNMESVEEICDHIALINKAEKILDGSVKEVKEAYRANIYELNFVGNKMGFTNALWTGAELLDFQNKGETQYAKVKLLGDVKSNDLLKALLPVAEIHSLGEVLPSMNDIFIQKVTEIETDDE